MPEFPASWTPLRTVLCHDWLTGMRGGERVLEILCQGFPKAPIYTLLHNPAAVSDLLNSHKIWTSWLQGIPGANRRYRYLLPLFPSAIELMDPPPADLVISTSHCVAKGLRRPAGARHLCYCFTPMRYAWLFYEEYFGRRPAMRLAAKALLPALRRWDLASLNRVDHFVAISRHVRDRIRRFYRRDADVVYPPVDTTRWTPASQPPLAQYDLVVSALVPYKNIELAVSAYNQSRFPLKIVGAGTELPRLKALAGPHVEFLGWQPDESILDLYRNCRLLAFPGEEDFGIVPLEVQACGRPVVAYGKGGVLETVVEGTTGVFFHEPTPASLLAAVEQCTTRPWDPAVIRSHAEQFSVQSFVDGMDAAIRKCLAAPSR